ncbi:3-isopropylmalate dehydratase small subunit [Elioraea sp.]|uniref:3-isopropylmalate dehydratase small subunit n=1 Tax=Elioraea sp. TaxID=2185103 RepID=UPI0025BFCADA|nr:3-isopropylmalate dehydratase small subunit [Elioraea sp.]
MQPFVAFRSVGAPLNRANINTDAIIPSAWLRSAEADLARGLFAAWRFDADGNEIADFVLNVPPFRTARLLFAGANFGCGSSREAAAWALKRFGFGCIAAPSFADIFHENALRNGLLPARISEEDLARAIALIEADPNTRFHVDLAGEAITPEAGLPFRFAIEAHRKEALLRGDDEIAATLRHGEAIAAHATADMAERPWLYAALAPDAAREKV